MSRLTAVAAVLLLLGCSATGADGTPPTPWAGSATVEAVPSDTAWAVPPGWRVLVVDDTLVVPVPAAGRVRTSRQCVAVGTERGAVCSTGRTAVVVRRTAPGCDRCEVDVRLDDGRTYDVDAGEDVALDVPRLVTVRGEPVVEIDDALGRSLHSTSASFHVARVTRQARFESAASVCRGRSPVCAHQAATAPRWACDATPDRSVACTRLVGRAPMTIRVLQGLLTVADLDELAR